MRLVLLPGMDGTGELFAPLIKILPKDLLPLVVAYPPNEQWGYPELLDFIRHQLPEDEDFVVLGESFSGPLALMLASDPPAQMRALICESKQLMGFPAMCSKSRFQYLACISKLQVTVLCLRSVINPCRYEYRI
jgi:pimeloyl-ACP methyl ester carboxylesterase